MVAFTDVDTRYIYDRGKLINPLRIYKNCEVYLVIMVNYFHFQTLLLCYFFALRILDRDLK